MVIKYLVISMSVTVTGPPFCICSLNRGITEPLEPITLPNLTIHKLVEFCYFESACKISLAHLFEAHIVLVGFTALSVEINTKVSTLDEMAA